jgi:hypothetical protein
MFSPAFGLAGLMMGNVPGYGLQSTTKTTIDKSKFSTGSTPNVIQSTPPPQMPYGLTDAHLGEADADGFRPVTAEGISQIQSQIKQVSPSNTGGLINTGKALGGLFGL